MRTITFAGLIILVGFVAALPFKKAPAPGSAESDSTLATGPSTGMAINESPVSFDQLVVVQDRQHEGGGYHREPSPPWSQPARSVPVDSVSAVSGRQIPARIPSDSRARPRRDLRVPLTYDDLAVPLATPHYVEERFGAVAKPSTRSAAPVEVAIKPEPKYQPMELGQDAPRMFANQSPYRAFDDQPQSILDEAESTPVPTNRGVEGKLVSDQSPSAEKTPPAEPARVRHWIRQPD